MVGRPFSRLGYRPRAGSLVERRDRFRDDVLPEVRIRRSNARSGVKDALLFSYRLTTEERDRRRPENCPENLL